MLLQQRAALPVQQLLANLPGLGTYCHGVVVLPHIQVCVKGDLDEQEFGKATVADLQLAPALAIILDHPPVDGFLCGSKQAGQQAAAMPGSNRKMQGIAITG